MLFALFLPLLNKSLRGEAAISLEALVKVMCSKSVKMVFVVRIIRHRLCMIYVFLDFFCSKIIFDQNLFSYCWDKFDYPGSIVYLSSFHWFETFNCPTFDYHIHAVQANVYNMIIESACGFVFHQTLTLPVIFQYT